MSTTWLISWFTCSYLRQNVPLTQKSILLALHYSLLNEVMCSKAMHWIVISKSQISSIKCTDHKVFIIYHKLYLLLHIIHKCLRCHTQWHHHGCTHAAVVIREPEQQACKASYCGSKQQLRSTDEITLLLLVRTVAIRNPKRHVRKASHCEGKQQ